jgi:hypothetical protein
MLGTNHASKSVHETGASPLGHDDAERRWLLSSARPGVEQVRD